MKQYIITYDHITGGKRVNTYDNIFELLQRLEELINDRYVSDDSISIHTENNASDSPAGALFFESNEDYNERIKQK